MEPDRRTNDAVNEDDEEDEVKGDADCRWKTAKSKKKKSRNRNNMPALIHTPRATTITNNDKRRRTTTTTNSSSMPSLSSIDNSRKIIMDDAQSAYQRRLQNEQLFYQEQGHQQQQHWRSHQWNQQLSYYDNSKIAAGKAMNEADAGGGQHCLPLLHLSATPPYPLTGGGSKLSSPPQPTSSSSSSSSPTPPSKTRNSTTNTKIPIIGNVGYTFHKEFNAGWFTGTVIKIMGNGDRRCVYTDGDIEDLYLNDLILLAKISPPQPTSSSSSPTPQSKTRNSTTNTKIPIIGNVGYTFHKEFDAGWFTGTVIKIMGNGDRRCVYTDGDIEDLYLNDLILLAKLDPRNNNNDNDSTITKGEDIIPTTLPPIITTISTLSSMEGLATTTAMRSSPSTTPNNWLDRNQVAAAKSMLDVASTINPVDGSTAKSDLIIDKVSGRLVINVAANDNEVKEEKEGQEQQSSTQQQKTVTSSMVDIVDRSCSSYLAQYQPPTLPPLFPITTISSSLSSSMTKETAPTTGVGGTTVFVPPVIHNPPLPPLTSATATSPHDHGHSNQYHHPSMMMMPPTLPPYNMMMPPLPPPSLPRSGTSTLGSSSSISSGMMVGQLQQMHLYPIMLQLITAQQQQQQQMAMIQQHPGGAGGLRGWVPNIVDLRFARMQQQQQHSALHGAAAAAYNLGHQYYHQHQHNISRGSQQQQIFSGQHTNLNQNEYNTTELDTKQHEQKHHKQHRSIDSTTSEADDKSLPPLPPLEHSCNEGHDDNDDDAAATGVELYDDIAVKSHTKKTKKRKSRNEI